jgi:hypothetical protein
LCSIPGTFAGFGKSSIKLLDALQNGTVLPEIQDGSSGDFKYLSCPTVETDPEVQQNYDEIFRQQLGGDPKIDDYFEGGTAVPPLPPHASFKELEVELAIIGNWIENQNSPLLRRIIAKGATPQNACILQILAIIGKWIV